MDENQAYIQSLRLEEVPWLRITTAYGRATELPAYLGSLEEMRDKSAVNAAIDAIGSNIEHQSTLWHATPFAMVFLLRILRSAVECADTNELAPAIAQRLLDLFILIAECYRDGDGMEHEEPLPRFSDLLEEQYLWPAEYDEEEDEMRWEDPFPDDLFYSFYYYSYQVLLTGKAFFSTLCQGAYASQANRLLELL